jgi:parallel beta-helix repeat protein
MAYSQQTWNDFDPAYPVTAARMAHIEAGVAAAAILTDLPAIYVPVTTGGAVTPPAILLVALFDGSDETTTLQAAITAAAGGTLYLPSGKTIKTQTVTPSSNTTIMAEGPGATIDIIDDGTGTSRYINVLNVSNITIQGITFKSTNATGRTGVNGLVRLSGATNVFIRQCAFGLSPATAVFAKTSTNVELSGNTVNGTYADGFHISRGCINVRIFGNNIQGTGDDCISVNSQRADGATTYGICEEVSIFGNTIGAQTSSANPGSGIALYGGTNITVVGNVIKGVSNAGILCVAVESGGLSTYYPYGIVISGNTIENPTGTYASSGDGIYISDARQVTVTGNRIDNTQRFGIYVYRIAKEITIANNAIMRAGSLSVYVQQFTTSPPALLITELYTNLGESGVVTPPMQSIKIIGNQLRQCGGTSAAINIAGESGTHADGIDISHNTVDPVNTGLADCILLTYADKSLIHGNHVLVTAANTISGIAMNTCSFGTVTGNIIVGPNTTGTGSGISYVTCSNVVVSGNVIRATTNGFFETGSSPCLVTGNVLQGITATNLQGTPLATSVYRGNMGGVNPVGVVTPAVPASTVAVAAIYYDRDFYVTAGATSVTCAIQSGPTVTVPASACVLVRVPAAKTMTPTYTNAPTWVVEGV